MGSREPLVQREARDTRKSVMPSAFYSHVEHGGPCDRFDPISHAMGNIDPAAWRAAWSGVREARARSPP